MSYNEEQRQQYRAALSAGDIIANAADLEAYEPALSDWQIEPGYLQRLSESSQKQLAQPIEVSGTAVFSDTLAKLLTSPGVPVANKYAGSSIRFVKGSVLRQWYAEGFTKGKAEFKEHHRFKDVNEADPEAYRRVMGCKLNEHENEYGKGWKACIAKYPKQLEPEFLRDVGYYSALVAGVYEVDRLNAPWFKKQPTTSSESRPEGPYFITEEFMQAARGNYRNRIDRDGNTRSVTHNTKKLHREGAPTYRVYDPLYTILAATQVPYHAEDGSIQYFRGRDFIKPYIEAFEQGIAHFKENFKLPPASLITPEGKEFARTINEHYHRIGCDNGRKGWAHVKKGPFSEPFNLRFVKEQGYYTGVVVECEAFMSLHPGVFQQQPTTSTKGRLENNFDSTPPEDVYAHFHNCLFQKGHLTEKELREFLSAAFQDMKPLEQKLELKNIQKSKAYALFYHYFKVVAKRNTRGNQPRYAALLGDYFAGFNTDSVSKNFSTEYTNQMKAEYGLIS